MSLRTLAQKSRVLVEDEVFTAPRRSFEPAIAVADEALASRRAQELRETGCTSFPGLVGQAEIESVRAAIDRAVASPATAKWSESVHYWVLVDPLLLHPAIVRWAALPEIVGVAERYFRRAPYLADVDLRRVAPVDHKDLGPAHVSSSTWHKDTRGRQLKLMIYLSDVAEHDSNFAFVPGSHLERYSRAGRFDESRLTDEEVAGAKVHEWYGHAGDAMLFDTNLIHRLRRKGGAAVRDSVTYYYTPGQALYALRHEPRALEGLSQPLRAMFGRPRWPLVRR